MNAILDLLNFDMQKPLLYGNLKDSWFQYLSLIFMVFFSYLAIKKMKGMNDQQVNKVLIGMTVIMWVFEIYKQVIFSYQANWSYMWYAFPFQFCSVAMYIAPIIPLIKNKKIRSSMITFLATYTLFSGLAVMFYPATVYVTTIGINIQTMVHHGLLVIVGVGLLVNHIDHKWESFVGSMGIFLVLLVIAATLNLVHTKYIDSGTFNMFFINPRFENGLPILGAIQPLVGPVSFIIIYYLGFSFISFLIYFITVLFYNYNVEKKIKMQIT